MQTAGIYIHIPFCVSKCKYCDFNSGVYDESICKLYFDSLKNEIKEAENHSLVVDTVFFGGGTPSSVDPQYIAVLIDLIKNSFVLSPSAEISLEINPGTLDSKKAAVYRSAGINRVSIGLQTSDNRLLEILGRTHTFEDFCESYGILRQTGFNNINIDIMYAIPGQSLSDFNKTLLCVIDLNPDHVSSYSLIFEDGTTFMRDLKSGLLKKCDEETDREMFLLCRNILADNGFNRYEVSNFSKEGLECRHNIKYWRRDPYLGFGLSAHSFFNGYRYYNSGNMNEYIKKNGICNSEKTYINNEEAMSEYIMLGLRMTEGIDIADFNKRFHVEFNKKFNNIQVLLNNGLARIDGNRFRLTDKGMDVMNSVLVEMGI